MCLTAYPFQNVQISESIQTAETQDAVCLLQEHLVTKCGLDSVGVSAQIKKSTGIITLQALGKRPCGNPLRGNGINKNI